MEFDLPMVRVQVELTSSVIWEAGLEKTSKGHLNPQLPLGMSTGTHSHRAGAERNLRRKNLANTAPLGCALALTVSWRKKRLEHSRSNFRQAEPSVWFKSSLRIIPQMETAQIARSLSQGWGIISSVAPFPVHHLPLCPTYRG